MFIKRIMILVACISLLSAYAATPEATNSSSNTNNSGFKFSPIAHAHTAELLEFIANYPSLDKKNQQSVYREVMQALAKDKDDIKLRIKHAAVLALPNSSLRDTGVALEHLQALLEDHTLSESNTSLVKLLHTFTLDYNTMAQKLHDTAKKTDALKQKNKALKQKLNDLKNIEKTMIERNTKSNANP